MNKKRTKKNIKFILFILIMCIVVFFGYYIIKGEKNPIFGFINKITEKEIVKDNYNGIYTYYDDLNGSKFVFSGCSLSRIANYLLIMDDNYYLFRSSCMGTYPKGTGKTDDLFIRLDNDKKDYLVTYDNKVYERDYATMSIVPNNNIEKEMQNIELSSYQLFMRETEFKGNYYNIQDLKINGISSSIKMSILYNYDDNFNLILTSDKTGHTLYSYNITNYDYLPDMYAYGKNVVVIEKGKNKNDSNRLGYNFKVVNLDGIVYKLEDMFPIIINDVTLNSNNSIFITFDSSHRVYKLLIGFDDKMCVSNYEESEKDDITYYEFTIDYNYSINGFDKPKFSKIGTKAEGCKYVDSVMGR